MRIAIFIKSFFYFSFLTILLIVYKSVIDLKIVYTIKPVLDLKYFKNNVTIVPTVTEENITPSVHKNKLNLKYILQWTSAKNVPFVYMGEGQEGFLSRNCSFTNCYVTNNRSYLGDYTEFDVIAFAGPEVRFMIGFSYTDHVPVKRSLHQKYAFASIESADNYPICTDAFNDFFNWTWTYRLESEAKWGYIVIRDAQNNIIGPKTNMNWIKWEQMDAVSNDIKEKIKKKTKAVAWFVSNCISRSRREIFARDLGIWLANYDLEIDIYGRCGKLECSRDNEAECDKMIERDYYFYLSFENSFAEDYVTEKLLHPLKYLAVPIVYGGANYSRFMPDNIYLNARELGPRKLANKINELIENQDLYVEYFRWRKYYSYHKRHESIETDDYCRFCSMLNDEELVTKTSTYQDFKHWWDPPGRCET